jgi:hypothetical protein
MKIWTYRPSEEEQAALLEWAGRGDFPSIAAIVREGVLRLIHEEDPRMVYGKLYDKLQLASSMVEGLYLEEREKHGHSE